MADPGASVSAKRRSKSFQLPRLDPMRRKSQINGRMSHAVLSMASDQRILEATPSLKALYAFLGKKP